MVRVEGRRIVRAPVQKVFQLVSRVDVQPRVTGLWLAADLVERKSNSLTVHYRGYFGGMPVESIQRATLFPPQRVEFRQTRGALKAFRGEYLLKPVDGDTELALSVEAEVGIPLISEASARLILHDFVEHSLAKFKFAAERDLPRVLRRPHDAAAPSEGKEAAPALEAEAPAPEMPAVEPAGAGAQPPPRSQPPQPGSAAPGAQPGSGRRRRRRRRRRRGGGHRPHGGTGDQGPATR